MNIFAVDNDPIAAAQALCDVHVVKMILESVQLLCTYCHRRELIFGSMYKPTHRNHPCSLWLLESPHNVSWLIAHAQALAAEYTYRYQRQHKSITVLSDCIKVLNLNAADYSLHTPFPLCMGNEFKIAGNAIDSYRAYYLSKQFSMARAMKWTARPAPQWFVQSEVFAC